MTDHSLINIQLTISKGCRGKGMWKLNTNILLKDQEFVNQTNEFIKEVIQKWSVKYCTKMGDA